MLPPPTSTAAFCAAPGFHFSLEVEERPLHFRKPARTSRGDLSCMERYEIIARTQDGLCGRGEATPMPGLSPEAGGDYAERLRTACKTVEMAGALAPEALADAPSMRFGIECALLSARVNGASLWNTPFSRGEAGLAIHHLIWMDTAERMLEQMEAGIARGFRCLKFKVGALPWAEELALLHEARRRFPRAELRADANGAWTPAEAADKLAALAEAGVALTEQPLRPGQMEALASLIATTPMPLALDEELIAARSHQQRAEWLDRLRPYALVLKPSLHGGLSGTEDWVKLASARGIRWWVNSALEGPVGHAALADWCALHAPDTLHGLGTGNLYRDATPGRVTLCGNELRTST